MLFAVEADDFFYCLFVSILEGALNDVGAVLLPVDACQVALPEHVFGNPIQVGRLSVALFLVGKVYVVIALDEVEVAAVLDVECVFEGE